MHAFGRSSDPLSGARGNLLETLEKTEVSKFDLIYSAPPVALLAPAADAAGRTGAYKSLRGVSQSIALVCRVNQGNAAQVTFTPLQAKDSSGTGSKVITAVPVFYNADTSVSDTLVAQGSAANFQTDATTKDKFVVFRFYPAELDLPNGFNHIAIQTSASNSANITEAFMIAVGRFQQTVPMASEV